MRIKAGNRFKDWLQLSKINIMLPVSLTGFTGYFVYDPHLNAKIFLATSGVLLLAISASVLNQIQEAELDYKMERTQYRPIPAKRIKLYHAALFCTFTLFAGTTVLYLAGNLNAALIGLVNILWYNGIYTYSKRITAFAVVPGAVTGALPPVIGWVAAGGGLWEKPIIFIAFLLFIGQIPHFWLLIMKYGEDYKQAGIPSLTDIFTLSQISRLTFTWVVTSVAAALFLCYFEIIQSRLIIAVLIAVSIYIIWRFTDLLTTGINKNNYRKYSRVLDFYFLLVLLLLISDRII
jgi:protoheme IX farnesyltransferase